MQDDRDYYTILGVPADAPEAEVRRAFRARAKELHPDSKPSGEHDEAHGEFSLLAEAYETLKDAGRRQAYDDALRSSRQLTARGASESKPPRAFAMGLALG
ncbi:MAG: J domain-containing protein, partial [Rhodomicrobium sp.]